MSSIDQLVAELDLEGVNVNRKYSVFKHRKKQAANDAQLLMNRIALIQKEEERARKKIEKTKSRAFEILALRDENERRMQAWLEASNEDEKIQEEMHMKIKGKEKEAASKRQTKFSQLREQKAAEVSEMRQQRRNILREIVRYQEDEIKRNKERKAEVKRQEEEARQRRELEKMEQDRRVLEAYEKKAAEEASEAKRAEKLVKILERKEKEWLEKLREAQSTQETAFEYLELALLKDASGPDLLENLKEDSRAQSRGSSARGGRSNKGGMVSSSFDPLPVSAGNIVKSTAVSVTTLGSNSSGKASLEKLPVSAKAATSFPFTPMESRTKISNIKRGEV